MPRPSAWFRLPLDLVEDLPKLRRVIEQLGAVVATSNTRKPMAGPAAGNPCDEDPNCYFVGIVTIDGVIYHAYECNGDIVLYPAIG